MNQRELLQLVWELLKVVAYANEETNIPEDWQFVLGHDLLTGFIEDYAIYWDSMKHLVQLPGDPAPRPYENIYKLGAEIFERKAQSS